MEPVGGREILIKLGRVLGQQPGHVQQGPGGRHGGQLLDVDQQVQELDAEELVQVARVLGGEGPGQGLVLEPQHPDNIPDRLRPGIVKGSLNYHNYSLLYQVISAVLGVV